ncbi:uncharacterized protein FYW61_013082 [Anableps anableps]
MEEDVAHQQLCKQEKNFSLDQKEAEPLQIKEEQEEQEHQRITGQQEGRGPPLLKEEQQEFEASQIKEEEEELCVSQDEDHLLLKWKTYTFEVSPVHEQKYHLEPDGNQLDLQDAPEAENQDQEENDSRLRRDEQLEPNRRCWKNLFSGEMHDGVFPQDSSKTKRMTIHTARLQSVYFVDEPRVEEESATTAVGEAKFAEVERVESHPWPHLKDYFFFKARDKSNEKTLHFQCVLCQPKKITIKGQAKSLYNLKSHINRKHPAHATQFEEDVKAGSSRGKHRLSVGSSASSQSSQPCAKRLRQPSIGETPFKTAATDVSQSMVDKQIVDLFVHNVLPLHVVESPTFVGLIKMLNPGMTSMSRRTLSRRMLASHEQLEEYLIRLLENIPWVATTADCWSAHNKSYLGMTAHWLDPKTRTRRRAVLACSRIKGHHTFHVLAKAVVETHCKFNLQDKVTRTTTDNGKNFVKTFVQFGAEAKFLSDIPEVAPSSEEDAIQDVDLEAGGVDDVEYISVDPILDKSSGLGLKLPVHMKCAAHNFNLVASVDASEALDSALFKSAYRKAMSNARELWNLHNRSTVAADGIFDVLKRRLVVPNNTRWNSTYDSVVVLNSLLEKNRDAVQRVMTQQKLQTFTDSDVGFLSEYAQVMSNVAKALDKIQGEDQAYLGSLLPTVAATVMRLKEVKLKCLLYCSPLVDALLAGISKRFGPLLEDQECQLAAAFHPKFRLFWLEQFNNSQVSKVTKAMETVVQTAMGTIDEEGSSEEDEEDDFFSNITRSCDSRSHRSLKCKAQSLVKTWLEASSKDVTTDRAFLEVSSTAEGRPKSFRRQTSKHQCSETQDSGLRTRVPPVESDDSCLSDSDDSDEDNRPKPGDESSSDEDSDSNSDPPASTSAFTRSASTETRSWRKLPWETVQPQNSAKDIPTWRGSLPGADETREPIQYFRDFFDTDLLNTIVQQSNLYFTQESKHNRYSGLKLDRNELEQFIGTLVYMSVVHLPTSGMYWSSECRVEQVADVITRERWKKIKEFLHFNDNSDMATNSGDALFKIRPVFDSLLHKFNSLPQDQMLSVVQQMVPFKGDSSLMQYTPKRSRKWGYKVFVLCDTKGLVHSFDIFTGKIDPVPGEPDIGASGNIVLKLAQVIHGSFNHLLYFDSWFTSFDLFAALNNKGIPALGAVEQSGLQGCSFSTDPEMKKRGMGSFEEKRAAVDSLEIRAVKWFDYRGVIVASTFASSQPVANVQRWDRKLKQKISVEYPNIISLYNKFVAGVDALDALITSHRIQIRSRKYYHRLFCHFVDMVIVNSWLLYQRDCESLGVPRKTQKDFLAFRISIAQALCMQGKDLSSKKRGWPFFDVESEFEKKKRRGPAKAIPTLKVRSDAVGHWPVVESGRQRCKLPNCKGQTVFKCSKCNVHLCLKKNKNCFGEFHK